jgi:hypothetical protein
MEQEKQAVEPERIYSGPIDYAGAVISVYGWYGEQEWVKVKLVRRTSFGWLVERVASTDQVVAL